MIAARTARTIKGLGVYKSNVKAPMVETATIPNPPTNEYAPASGPGLKAYVRRALARSASEQMIVPIWQTPINPAATMAVGVRTSPSPAKPAGAPSLPGKPKAKSTYPPRPQREARESIASADVASASTPTKGERSSADSCATPEMIDVQVYASRHCRLISFAGIVGSGRWWQRPDV